MFITQSSALTAARFRPWIELGFVSCYVLLDWLSFIQPVLNLGITPWSPQTGLALAYLLVFGWARTPVVAVAAFLAEVIVRDSPAAPLLFATSSVLIALTYGVTAAVLGRATVESATRFLAQAARAAITIVIGALVAAIAYVCVFAAGGALPWDSAVESVTRYWIGDVNGVLMFTPLLLALPAWRRALHAVRARIFEVATQALLVVAFVLLFFGMNVTDHMRFFYPLFVPVIWIACRWGAGGALIAALGIQIGLVIAVQDLQLTEPLVDLQFLMLTLCLTGLLLGAVVRERADALARVATGEAELRALLSAAPDAVVTVSPGGEAATMNAAARQLFGQTPEIGAPPLDQLLPGLKMGAVEGRAELEGRRVDGSAFPAEVAWTPLHEPARPGWLLIVRDVTERLQAQVEARGRDLMLARAMRFAVAGELASALAHELNQPITALVSYVRASEILAAPVVEDARLTETLAKAGKEAIRAANVLRRLRDFYQGRAGRRALVDLAAFCDTVAKSLESRIGAQNIHFTLDCASDVPPIYSDAMQLEIVLHNLMANAIDSLSSKTGDRQLRIEMRANDELATIAVEDSGAGIAPEARKMLFEPFNTTKVDGMGLGLAISRSLVRGLGGDLIHTTGERLKGARFCVTLPVNSSAPGDENP